MGQYCTGDFLMQCWHKQIRKKLYIVFQCKFVCGLWVNIAHAVFLCNVGPGRLRQHCIGYLPVKLRTLAQHCTSNLLFRATLSQMYLDNIE